MFIEIVLKKEKKLCLVDINKGLFLCVNFLCVNICLFFIVNDIVVELIHLMHNLVFHL